MVAQTVFSNPVPGECIQFIQRDAGFQILAGLGLPLQAYFILEKTGEFAGDYDMVIPQLKNALWQPKLNRIRLGELQQHLFAKLQLRRNLP